MGSEVLVGLLDNENKFLVSLSNGHILCKPHLDTVGDGITLGVPSISRGSYSFVHSTCDSGSCLHLVLLVALKTSLSWDECIAKHRCRDKLSGLVTARGRGPTTVQTRGKASRRRLLLS